MNSVLVINYKCSIFDMLLYCFKLSFLELLNFSNMNPASCKSTWVNLEH